MFTTKGTLKTLVFPSKKLRTLIVIALVGIDGGRKYRKEKRKGQCQAWTGYFPTLFRSLKTLPPSSRHNQTTTRKRRSTAKYKQRHKTSDS